MKANLDNSFGKFCYKGGKTIEYKMSGEMGLKDGLIFKDGRNETHF